MRKAYLAIVLLLALFISFGQQIGEAAKQAPVGVVIVGPPEFKTDDYFGSIDDFFGKAKCDLSYGDDVQTDFERYIVVNKTHMVEFESASEQGDSVKSTIRARIDAWKKCMRTVQDDIVAALNL